MADVATLLRQGSREGAADRSQKAARDFARRAGEEGLADVSYASIGSPVGELLIAATRRGLVTVGLTPDYAETALERIARRVSPRIVESPAALDDERRQLEEYFAGERERFDLRLDWRLAGQGFARRVLEATRRLHYGETMTYAQAAGKAGIPTAYRAAGNALGANPIPIVVPCHRVLASSGGLGGYGGGLDMKRHLLRLEGVAGV